MTQASTSRFYSDLSAFRDFKKIADLCDFEPLPDDWSLLVTDVVNSTGAIEAGQYKKVNMVGAASIISVLNECPKTQLPYVFGGDGGLVAVPPDLLEKASKGLRQLKSTSSSMFDLDLRAAAIPVSDLRAEGADTLVRKYRLSKDNHLAMFAGDGPQLADRWLKEDDTSRGYALLETEQQQAPDLNGLSCRWEPLRTRNGTMLTLMVKPYAKDASKEIEGITRSFAEILGGPVSQFAPAHEQTMTFRFPPSGLAYEIAANKGYQSRVKATAWIYFTAFMQSLCERFDLTIGDYRGATYRDEVKTNTDYRKYDGMLRMVLDVTAKQAANITQFLEKEHQAGKLIYGTWQADAALMTCLLFSLSTSQHVHFIDGANGGYAMAAKDMKQRLVGLTGK